MTHDTLAWWEKASAGALFVASGLYAAEWYIGARMPPEIAAAMPWVATLGGVVTLFAIDGALVATVMGARAGRRSRWTWWTIAVAAVFGALVALVLHGALPAGVGAWLHAGFMATAALYLMHLAQPRADVAVALALREQEVARQVADLEQAAADLTRREQAVAQREQAPIRVEQVETIRVATRELTWPQLERLVKEAVQRNATSVSSLRRLVDGVKE